MQNSRLDRRPAGAGGANRLIEGSLGWLITLVVIPVLIVAVLLLPPISLLDRLQLFTYTRIGAGGGAVTDPDGTTVAFPSEGVVTTFLANLSSIPRADFLAGQVRPELYEAASRLPAHLLPKSPLYSMEVRGTTPNQVVVTIPIPNDSLPYETLGLYSWTGETWRLLPNHVLTADEVVEARLDYVPANFMVMQTQPPVPAVTADLGLAGQLPQGATVTGIAQAGLYLRGDGALDGTPPVNTGATVPVIRNWDGDGASVSTVRTDLINNLLLDPGQQENQLTAVEQLVVQQNYPGVIIDYRGVDALPSARADFVHLITRMAERLHAAGKTLTVRVEPASPISAEEWDTKGYDWRALGQVVDKLRIPAPEDPRAYRPGGDMEALLRFATSEVERRKLQIELPGVSIERSGPYLLMKGYQEALRPLLGQIQAESGSTGEMTLSLDNPRLLEQVTLDAEIGMYTYKYTDDQGFERTVYIENASSISHKLNLLDKYNVSDVTLRAGGDVDPNLWNVLLQFQQGAELSTSSGNISVAYAVYKADGSLLASNVRPLEDSRLALPVAEGGELRIEAQLVSERGEALSPLQSTVVSGNKPAAAPVAAAEAEVAETTAVAVTQEAPAATQLAKVIPSQVLNVRGGPSTNYTILGQITPEGTYNIIGKNEAGDWWQIDVGNNQTGWVIGQLVRTDGEVSAVQVAADIPEEPVAAAAAAPPPASDQPAASEPAAPAAPASAPAISAPAPSGGVAFGYGVQAHMVHANNEGQVMGMVQGLGFNWIKQQIEWKVFEAGGEGQRDFGSSDGIVNAANGAGISLLFSVVNAPAWAREPGFDGSVGGPPANPQTYANFVGALAGRYCGSSLKAIEVWNEQNLHYEWGNKPLNAAEYVALLAPAYAAIKAACPSMYVISGAPTPAGNNPPYAMDDMQYLEAMFQAGMANYADGIGSHPSGYNVPPAYTWDQACAAIQKYGNSFNGACDSPHHSWSFRSTMEGYWNIMNKYGAGNKKIWPTEFGWAAGGAFDARYQYANDNSFEEQAAWTVEAYQMMKNWGFVGPAFLWNLNFRMVANGTEKAQWGIVDPGGSPLPVYNALAAMPK